MTATLERHTEPQDETLHGRGAFFPFFSQVGLEEVAELAVKLRPRYHFCGGEGAFWQRPPYRLDARSHACRMVGLSRVQVPLPPRYPHPPPTPTVPQPTPRARLVPRRTRSRPGSRPSGWCRRREIWGDMGRCGSGESTSNDFRPVVQARNGTRSSRHQPTRRTKCGAVGGTRRRRPSPARGHHGLPVPLRRPHRWRRRRRRGEARRARGQAAARGVGEGWARLGSPSSVGSASSLPYLPISPHKAQLDRRAVLVLQEPSRNLLGTF